jgi:hypothetical protein
MRKISWNGTNGCGMKIMTPLSTLLTLEDVLNTRSIMSMIQRRPMIILVWGIIVIDVGNKFEDGARWIWDMGRES